jgi:anti-sigma factor (TIGR02949 family)
LLTCKEFVGWLNECLDKTADAETRELVQQHVNNCPNCWVVYDTTKKTLDIYKGMEPQAVPDALKSKIMAALQKCKSGN